MRLQPELANGSCSASKITRALLNLGPLTTSQLSLASKVKHNNLSFSIKHANALLEVPGWRINRTGHTYTLDRLSD